MLNLLAILGLGYFLYRVYPTLGILFTTSMSVIWLTASYIGM